MKTKLFRFATLLLVLSSVVSMAIAPNTSADAATDQQAVNLIATCKGQRGPFPADSDCREYTNCLGAGNDELCKAVKRFNGTVSTLQQGTRASCQKVAGNTADSCAAAYGNCVYFRIKEGKISAADTKTCVDLIAKGDLAAANKNPNAEKTECVIDGVGWIICPTVSLIARIVDAAYLFVSSLLVVQPLLTDTGSGNSVYQAWSIMRNFANVAFVIAFLIIIFSQVSSIGITNYGIKKLLPKLVVSAVLVNISYWVCAIAVDVSNIMGVSINGLFDSIKASLAAPSGEWGGTGWQVIAGGILSGTLAVGALLYVGLSALLPILITVLLAIVVVFLVLTLRQALIILLIVIAPLAFVAYLLPNTESLFKKWRDLFQTLLLMYPIIALIFGASALASKIIMASASGNYKIAIQIMGAGVAVIPLALTPIVMKTAGGVLNRFGGFINNPNKGPFDRMRKGAEGYRDYRKEENTKARLTRARSILGEKGKVLGDKDSRRRKTWAYARSAGSTWSANTERKRNISKALAGEATDEYLAERASRDENFAISMASGDKRAVGGVQSSAQAAVKKIFDQDVANREVLLRAKVEFLNHPEDALKKAIEDGDAIGAVAAQNMLYASGAGGITKFRDTVEDAETSKNPEIQKKMEGVTGALKANVKEKHGQYAKQKGVDVLTWANTDEAKLSETYGDAASLNPTELASQHSGSLQKMARHGTVNKEQVEKVLEDKRITGAQVDENKEKIFRDVEAGRPPAPKPPGNRFDDKP